jgi:two-component system, NarL family, response regulator NreC
MKKIRILLADDHTILREGIRSLLEDQPDMQVVAEAEDGQAAVALAAETAPDVALLDIAMPRLNGLEAARQIKRCAPQVKVLILSMYDNEEYIRSILASGALGYLLKDAGSRELLAAIRTVYRGKMVLSPAVTRLVVENYLRWGETLPNLTDPCLSPREREVLQLIAEGYANKQIAEILTISIKTVQAHRSRLMEKLNLHDRGELIKYAIQKKIIEI